MARDSVRPQDKNDSPETGVGATMWLRTIIIIVLLPAIILFGAAGTFNWPMAWFYMVFSVAGFAVSRLIVWRNNPDLLRERGRMMDHEDTAAFDRVLAPLLALVGPTLIGIVAGLALRFEWSPVFSPGLMWVGVALLVLGHAFGSWALVVNRFFSGVVRIQKERDHHVVTSGPYAIVRHPGYLGACFIYLGMVLMLGSPWALIPYALELAVLVARTALEDRLLQAKLPGYAQYAQQTRFRLIPGIW
jgi:protein-S-isoprenylcysteine O-methyltransferase Ste14